jgi:ligand-binding sensor domain-containing protein
MRKVTSLFSWLAALCTALSLSCSHVSIAGTETGNGTAGAVVGLTGKPVAGAQVTLVPVDYNVFNAASGSFPIRSTETDSRGRYCFYDVAQGSYNLFCDSGANSSYLDSLTVNDETDTTPTAFLRKSGSLTGSAFISSGRIVHSGFVTIIGSNLIAPVSGNNGAFNFPGLAPGTYSAEIITQENGFFKRHLALCINEGRADTIKNPFLLVSTFVTALQSDSTGMWIGTMNGLARVGDDTWRTYGLHSGLSSSRINCLYGNTSGMWAGTSLRLARIRSDTLAENIVPSGTPAVTNITALGGDSSGTIWIGTPQGLFLLSKGTIAAITGNDALTGLASARPQNKLTSVSALLCLQQETIVGTLHGVYFRDSAGTWREIPEMTTLAVSSIACGGGMVWFGTNQGVRSWDRISRTVAAPFDGQATGAVTCLAVGENDSLFIGTADGLFTAAGSVITKKDLGAGSVCVNALCRDREGALWVGTAEGVILIERGEIRLVR